MLGLPGDMQPALLHDLLEIIDLPDRMAKVTRTREIFRAAKAQMEAPYREKMDNLDRDYADRFKKAGTYVVAPGFPMPRISINRPLVEEKAKARLTLQAIEEEISEIPPASNFLLYAAVMGILLSTIANFMTINSKLGSDFMGGNELASTICSIFFALVLCVFEAIGFYCLLHWMPKRYTNGFSRILGMVGAVVIIVSVCIAIFSRVDVGSPVISNTQEMGKVE